MDERRQLAVGGLLTGMGLGGFVDGIVVHQLLQWHHMGTGTDDHGLPLADVGDLQDNVAWDGLFHTGTWVLTAVGLLVVWGAVRRGRPAGWGGLVGLLLAGWGLFNLVEGVVNHHLLGIHHVRDDLGAPLSWDLGFLALGATLVVVGTLLWRADRDPREGFIDLREPADVPAARRTGPPVLRPAEDPDRPYPPIRRSVGRR